MSKKAWICLIVLMMLAVASAADIARVKAKVRGLRAPNLAICTGDEVKIEVKVRGKDETVYVGATIRDSEGNEQDFDVFHLRFGSVVYGIGAEEKTRTFIGRISEDLERGSLRYMVAIWESIEYDCGCSYCRKNGYHMEGRIEDTGWKNLGVKGTTEFDLDW